jgi:surface protein
MFNNCSKLTNIDVSSFNTSNVTGSAQMFQGCKALVDLDLSHFDFSKVNSIITMFGNCTNLTNFKSPKNVGKAFTQKTNNYQPYQMTYSSSTKLTHESLIDIFDNLYDLNLIHNTANGGTLYTQKLTIGATNKAKLTSEEIAIATNKGYTVA